MRHVEATLFAATAVAVLGTPVLAFAQGHAGFTFTIHGFYIIDFLVFVGILVYFGRKPIAAMLDQRYKNVAVDIEQAKALRQRAEAKYEEYRLRLEHLQEELERVIDEVRAGTERERERIIDDAHAEVDRIKADARDRLAQETKRIREDLAVHGANVALELAELEIRERLRAEDARWPVIERCVGEFERRRSAEVAR